MLDRPELQSPEQVPTRVGDLGAWDVTLGLKAIALVWLAVASDPENLEPGQKPGFAAWLGLAQSVYGTGQGKLERLRDRVTNNHR